MLLEREEVNPDKPDDSGRSPLSYAASGNHEDVVRMLLRRAEVTPDTLDNDGRTPLWYATQGGYKGVAKMLLDAGRSTLTGQKTVAKCHSCPHLSMAFRS